MVTRISHCSTESTDARSSCSTWLRNSTTSRSQTGHGIPKPKRSTGIDSSVISRTSTSTITRAVAVMKIIRFWLDRGVDRLLLDAVPHLFERDGTTCENLRRRMGF